MDRRASVQGGLAAAGQLDAASDARFQFQLPFEPVNHPRLDALKADRESARQAARRTRIGPLVDRRRHAQIAARHALHQIGVGFRARQAVNGERGERSAQAERPEKAAARSEQARAMAAVFDAIDLQLPESWIPFVMSRSRAR